MKYLKEFSHYSDYQAFISGGQICLMYHTVKLKTKCIINNFQFIKSPTML